RKGLQGLAWRSPEPPATLLYVRFQPAAASEGEKKRPAASPQRAVFIVAPGKQGPDQALSG
ncbi:hypothetical protein, partial [Pseudomonas sp. BIOMIG1BD]|uniref:hypothetical protein n=1 Tax=Pseudomonas sp. BIOMIG1BD TaxID=1758731 RepID=UPI0019D3650E